MTAGAVTALLNTGLEMDKATTAAAVRATINTVDRSKPDDRPPLADMLQMLHVVVDDVLRHL